jgi:branched-subunit amino acid aminotransferase/4-amino-4-deoxychorismate lyase
MFLDGKPATTDDMKALALANYGHFTSMRVDGHHVRGLGLHMERLARDCQVLFDNDLDAGHVRQLVRQAVGAATGSLVVRVTVFDPALELGHPGARARPHVLVTTREPASQPLPPIRLQSTHYEREMPSVKHVGLLATMYRRRQAQLHGFDDVVFTDAARVISEGATWNIGFIDGDAIVWPDRPCLPGVTMELLSRLRPSTVAELNMDGIGRLSGAFITNAAVGVRAVAGIDDVSWPEPHPLVQQLAEQYAEVHGEPL